MTLSAYFYVNRGKEYDLPFMEVLRSATGFCDEVIIGTDPRFEDGTLQELERVAGEAGTVRLIVKEFDFNDENPHALIKNTLRKECTGDWLLELDADKVITRDTGLAIKKALGQVHDRIYLVSLGMIQLFNGDHVKLEMPMQQEMVSRNRPDIMHGGEGRGGATYVTKRGHAISAGVLLSGKNPCNPKQNEIWVYHYGWYNLPRRWEMKQMHHYYEGRRSGRYTSTEDYDFNLDGEPVDFWDLPWQHTFDHYQGAIIAEMKHPTVKRFRGKHPDIMKLWMERQQDRIWRGRRNKWLFA